MSTSPPVPARQALPLASLASEPPVYSKPHAAPAVRRFARELGVDLHKVEGSGNKARILEGDVKAYVRQVMAELAGSGNVSGVAKPSPAASDFAKYGEVEVSPARAVRYSDANRHRVRLDIPMVSHHDGADLTALDDWRRQQPGGHGERLPLTVFLAKALAATLRVFPTFNASLADGAESLVLKRYVHIGVAVDSPGGLVVPVLRDVDRKGLAGLAEELMAASVRARAGDLDPGELEGASMSVVNLGGIGGWGFSPIVMPPEVAILGATRSRVMPCWNGSEFVPRLILPLDLTYDHRVIDGADAARFMRHYCGLLADPRRLIL